MDIDPLIRLLFSRIGYPPIESATDFSRQSVFGRCPECSGFGQIVSPDLDKLVDFDKSLRKHAVQFKPLSPSGWQGQWMMTCGLFDPDKPIKDIQKKRMTYLFMDHQEAALLTRRFIQKTDHKMRSGTGY